MNGSNTGICNGCCTLLVNLLERQVLWLACRHHILEFILKATFTELFVFEDTADLEQTFFRFMKTSWSSLNLSYIQLPKIPAIYSEDAVSLVAFIDHQLMPENLEFLLRGDYREFLELAKLILGGTLQRKNRYTYTIQRPGANSRARWMSKAIYTLKLTLLKHQFPELSWNKKQKLDKMTFFILFVYLESWFRSSSLFTAACDDLKLHQRLLKFRNIRKKLANVGLLVLQRHTCYLTQELVPVCSFNNVSEDMKNKIAEKISNLPVDNLSIQKPILPKIHYEVNHKQQKLHRMS